MSWREAGPVETRELNCFGPSATPVFFHWASRVVWYRQNGQLAPVRLSVSRTADRNNATGGIALSLDDEAGTEVPDSPIAHISEDELRELLTAVGCEWAKKSGGEQP